MKRDLLKRDLLKRDLMKLVSGILLGGVTVLVVTPACGSPASSAPTQLSSPAAAPAATATPRPAVNAATPANPQPANQPANAPSTDLLAKGKLIFEKTAGGVGCAYCHGLDGKGNGTAGVGAPPNRGAAEAKVRAALSGGVPLMSFIKLTEDEITAVVAYLQYLNDQP